MEAVASSDPGEEQRLPFCLTWQGPSIASASATVRPGSRRGRCPNREGGSHLSDRDETSSASLPDLASALNNLGSRYSEVGKRKEALAPVEEAVSTIGP